MTDEEKKTERAAYKTSDISEKRSFSGKIKSTFHNVLSVSFGKIYKNIGQKIYWFLQMILLIMMIY